MSWTLALLAATPLAAAMAAVSVVVTKEHLKRRGTHVHDWTQWIKTEPNIQERFCHSCGFTETEDSNPKPVCPPHDWGKWEKTTLNGGTVGQGRNCQVCGIRQLRDSTTISKDF